MKKYIRCIRCNRPLKDPVSMKRWFWPICRKRHLQETMIMKSLFYWIDERFSYNVDNKSQKDEKK